MIKITKNPDDIIQSGFFIILILLQTKFEQKGYDVMKRKYPNHVIFRNSNF